MPKQVLIDGEYFQTREKPVLVQHGDLNSIYDPVNVYKPRAITSRIPDQYVAHPGDIPAELVTAVEVSAEAHAALAEAQAHSEAYSLKSATWEEVSTMTHAVAGYGALIAEQAGTDSKKIELARVQLSDVMGDKINKISKADTQQVDPATFVLTALSLQRMQKITEDKAEQVVAGTALDSLRNSLPQFDEQEHFRLQDALGPHTGELAVAAILSHEHASK
jgi:hypothetical protein